ncbi:hypothetical protein NDU88_001558 [Pleurodeles waltl]|uniref:Uncharacterized protein n=1 Tax=Pleurodeles waltl TaxID=8319 RepID=A0AAV7KPV4_PLEWA|nr:hypothetical protein NDU88_001558 [Pleurodeles waltl]
MRGCWEGGAGTRVAAVRVAGVVTEVSATTRELPSEEISVSKLSPPVSAVGLRAPLALVPLVPSASVDSATWVLWDAAPSVAGASAPPPYDANAHKERVTKLEKEGEETKDTLCQWLDQHHHWRTHHPNTQGTALRTMQCTTSNNAGHQGMGRGTYRQLQHTWDRHSQDR